MAYGDGQSVKWWEWLIPGWNMTGTLGKSAADGVVNFKQGINDLQNPTYGNNPSYYHGGPSSLYGAKKINSGDLGAWFKQYAQQHGADAKTMAMLNQLSDAELGGSLQEYWGDQNVAFGVKQNTFDTASALQDLLNAQNLELPIERSYQDIWDEAAGKIDAENAKAAALYDDALKYQQNIYDRQLSGLGNDYNTYAKQALALDYVKNQQLLGNLEGTMNKARQNSLEAGASAGIRLANNVNTLMSTQNQQAMQSLQTSNNLAQMLLNQRNAAMGIQSNMANAYANNASQKAGLVKGDFERKQAAAGSAWDTYQQSYQNQLDAATGALGSNPFADLTKNYNQTQTYKKQTQSSSTGNGAY